MNIFLNADILVSVLNKEFPLFSLSSRIMSLQDDQRYKVYTSPLCLAITFCFAEKKSGTSAALKKISLLASKINTVTSGHNEVRQTVYNRKILDFEDGLEYYSALNAGCGIIITEDTGDFHFSEIEVLNCRQFFERYFGG